MSDETPRRRPQKSVPNLHAEGDVEHRRVLSEEEYRRFVKLFPAGRTDADRFFDLEVSVMNLGQEQIEARSWRNTFERQLTELSQTRTDDISAMKRHGEEQSKVVQAIRGAQTSRGPILIGMAIVFAVASLLAPGDWKTPAIAALAFAGAAEIVEKRMRARRDKRDGKSEPPPSGD